MLMRVAKIIEKPFNFFKSLQFFTSLAALQAPKRVNHDVNVRDSPPTAYFKAMYCLERPGIAGEMDRLVELRLTQPQAALRCPMPSFSHCAGHRGLA